MFSALQLGENMPILSHSIHYAKIHRYQSLRYIKINGIKKALNSGAQNKDNLHMSLSIVGPRIRTCHIISNIYMEIKKYG